MTTQREIRIPEVGKGCSVRVDQEMYDDLATFARCGMTPTDAVRHALDLVARAYRTAWDMGMVPEGHHLPIKSFEVDVDQCPPGWPKLSDASGAPYDERG